MKFEPNSKMTTVAIYAFLVIAAAIVFAMVIGGIGGLFGWFGRVIGYLNPVVYGFCIAFLLNPMLRMYETRLLPRIGGKRLRASACRAVSITLTYLTSLIVIALFLAIVLPQVIRSCGSLADNVPLYFKALQNWYRSVSRSVVAWEVFEDPEAAALLTGFSDSLMGTLQTALDGVGTWLATLSARVLGFAGNLAGAVIDFTVGVIVSIYLLADREKLFAQLRKTCTAILPSNVVELLYQVVIDTNRVFSGFIVGTIIDSLIVGALCFTGMSIFNMPYAMLISVIVGITNVIPYFGPFIGAIPSFFIILVSDPVAAFWFLIFILLLQQFDGNIISPKILGDTTGLSALWVILSIMLFGGLLGAVGMFIGVPLFAVLYLVFKQIIAFLLRRKGLPDDTRGYDTEKNPLIK